jgi:hypothetical protein
VGELLTINANRDTRSGELCNEAKGEKETERRGEGKRMRVKWAYMRKHVYHLSCKVGRADERNN